MNMPSLRVLALSSLFFCVFAHAQYPGATPPPASYKEGFQSISQEDCKHWLGYLAGPECQGRGTGQPGFQKAAEFMAARFKEFGLKPGGDNGTYFQGVPFYQTALKPDSSYIAVNGVRIGYKGNLIARALREITGEGDVVFMLGSGGYEEGSAKDKVVIVNDPETGTAASRDEALAVIQISAELPKEPQSQLRTQKPSGPPRAGRAYLYITQAAAKRLAGMLDVSVNLDAKQWTIARGSQKMEVAIQASSEEVRVPNVIGVLPGSDPVLKNEAVMIGAHLDHLGVQGDQVYWGADDDGSGSTALTAVAKAFSKNKVKPKRTIVFMAFCGEEMGLVGSRYHADHMLFPADKVSCELQMDMIGRNEEFRDRQGNVTEKPEDNVQTTHLVGSKRISTELHNMILDLNKHVGFTFEWDEEGVYTRSDHYSFAAKGIPIAFIFSGFHPDYHQPTDTIDKINFEKLANTAKLYYLVASTAANMPAMLKRDVTGG